MLERRSRRDPTADDIEAECIHIAREFPDRESLRIYFHDAPPATDTLTNPIDGSNAAVNRVFVPVIRHRPCCRRGQCVRKSRPLSALSLGRDGHRCRRSSDGPMRIMSQTPQPGEQGRRHHSEGYYAFHRFITRPVRSDTCAR